MALGMMWEKTANEVILQAVWPTMKSLMNKDGPRAPTAIGPLGLEFYSLEKANAIAVCLENQFTLHELCDENHA
jgi:hypothetical protein